MSTDQLTMAKYGLGVSVGFVLMLWAFESVHWYNYMRANPGTVSGGGPSLYYGLFMLGAAIAFTALLSGLHRTRYGAPEE